MLYFIYFNTVHVKFILVIIYSSVITDEVDLWMKYVGGFMFMDNLQFYFVHVLVYVCV